MSSSVELAISGMTCSTCASRIERKLNRVPGVHASVNYATESAHIDLDSDVPIAELVRVVEQTGYAAAPVSDSRGEDGDVDSLRRRFLVSLVLALPVVALSMVTALQFPGWQWVALALTTVIVGWGAWPFHSSAWANARHGASTMDTLVSLGVSVAYLWSLYALFFTHAGMIGMRMEMSLFGDNTHALYFESAAAVTAFVLLGRRASAKTASLDPDDPESNFYAPAAARGA